MQLNETLRILWLFPRFYWERKMSSVRRQSLLAIERRPDVDLRVSGIGWDDYDAQASVQENVEQLMRDCDLLGWYKPLGEAGPKQFPNDDVALRNPEQVTVPRCLRFNEAWWPNREAVREAHATGTELVICHHAEGLHRFRDDPEWKGQVESIAHCAATEVFGTAALPPEERDIPVLFTGAITSRLDPDLYPLRSRFDALMTDGRIPGERRIKPPNRTGGLEGTESQLRDYASHLARARILVTDGTRHRYPLAKYTEAAMAGTLVIGTLPLLPPPGFEDFVVPVDFDMSDDELVETVHYWLDNEDERAERAERGRQIVLENYTQDHYAGRFIDVVRRFLGDRARGPALVRQPDTGWSSS
jgi:glycosyltransferase involved in cell wall biosynthesis